MAKPEQRRRVEVYFVLYLAALTLLLPDLENDQKTVDINQAKSIAVPFQIIPEKSVLTCRLLRNHSNNTIISLDSINNIYFRGDVTDVEFDFIVEDQLRRAKYVINENSSNVFNVVKNYDNSSIQFRWQPILNDIVNKSYIVRVNAKAKDKFKPSLIYQSSSQFSLNLIFVNEDPVLTSNDINNQILNEIVNTSAENLTQNNTPVVIQNPSSFAQTANIDLQPESYNLKSVAMSKWTNKVFLYGVNPINGLLKNPEIKIVSQSEGSGGTASISNFLENAIVLEGTTPAYGKMRVELDIIRATDNKRVKTEFNIEPIAIQKPEFDRVMYPEMSYLIKSNLPLVTNAEVSCLLKDNDKIRHRAIEGEEFIFTPRLSDTGKVLSLERLVNGKLIETAHQIEVRNYPNPEIIGFEKSGDTILVRTKAYGFNDGRKNLVTSIVSENSSIKQRELIGKSREEKGYIFFQVFTLTNFKNIDVLRIKVKDTRNYESTRAEIKLK